MNTYEKCDNCGADEGLHHWDTKQCPKNGVEEWREGRKQEWEKTTFSIEKSQREKLLAENTEQKQLIEEREKEIKGLSAQLDLHIKKAKEQKQLIKELVEAVEKLRNWYTPGKTAIDELLTKAKAHV